MFHKEFYPTPVEVLHLMNIDCKNKIVLEPSAGKGDIVDYCKLNGSKDIIAFEIQKDLQKIVESKCNLIGEDFLTCQPEQVSHVNLIVMNPPFSNADKHIMHAWEIAPEGCEIIALCNWQTIEKDYRYRELSHIVRDYGNSENLGDCFATSERTTGVEVGLIKLYKPIVSDIFEFEGFFLEDEEEEAQGEGIMQYNEVRALVNRYVGAMKTFDLMKTQMDSLNYTLAPLKLNKIDLQIGYNNSVTTKEQFSKLIQKSSWQYIFDKMNMAKYVTSGVMKDINRFVETQSKVPFTMRNVYKMFDIIVGTREHTFNRALEEAIDNFTKHTHENRFGIEGWKTNSGYMLNKKIIVNWVFEAKDYGIYKGKLDIRHSSNASHIEDLVKVICNLKGDDYGDFKSLREFVYGFDGLESNKWYSWAYFNIKGYKKSTIHIEFQNIEDWYLLNQAYGKIKGFNLPETYKNKIKKNKQF